MEIFANWRHRKDFDLTAVQVPRLHREGPVVVEHLATMSPFLMEHESEPTVILRLEGLPGPEVAGLAEAVKNDRCLLVVGFKLYSTYPVLIFSTFIYDSLTDPLTVDGYRDVTSADVQDFVVSLGRNGGQGRLLLYDGDPPELIGSGRFALQIPPFFVPTKFPAQPSGTGLRMLWMIFQVVAQQRARIPEDRLDFKAAVATHMAREPNLSNRSEFDRSGIKSRSDSALQ